MENEKMDPVFCLESLERFEPEAQFTMTARSGQNVPHVEVTASMQNTGCASGVTKGFGKWVSFYDVLKLMIALKDQAN